MCVCLLACVCVCVRVCARVRIYNAMREQRSLSRESLRSASSATEERGRRMRSRSPSGGGGGGPKGGLGLHAALQVARRELVLRDQDLARAKEMAVTERRGRKQQVAAVELRLQEVMQELERTKRELQHTTAALRRVTAAAEAGGVTVSHLLTSAAAAAAAAEPGSPSPGSPTPGGRQGSDDEDDEQLFLSAPSEGTPAQSKGKIDLKRRRGGGSKTKKAGGKPGKREAEKGAGK